MVNDKIHYVQDNQLMDAKQWAVFVNQFRTHPDKTSGNWRGEYWGKMMRGACLTWCYTRDDALYRVLTDTVEDMLTAQDERGRYSTHRVDTEFTGWDMWCRKYVLMGMMFYHRICKEEERKERIVDSMIRHADYILDHVGPRESGKIPVTETSDMFSGINSSSILEPILFLYRTTGFKRYLEFGRHIIEQGGAQGRSIYRDAIEDKVLPYQYSSTKAYELTSFFEGIAEYYAITGDKNAYTAVTNYYRAILRSDLTQVGSLAINGELLSHATPEQSNPHFMGHKQETCVTVTWMKFCFRILQLTGDAAVADELERSIYNAMLGSVLKKEMHPHLFVSYIPMMFQARRNLGAGNQTFAEGGYYGCCEAIGSSGTGIIPIISTMKSENGLAVNLYLSGTVSTRTPTGKKLVLKTETNYPVDGEVKLIVGLESNESFDLLLRIPAWSKQTKVRVNGQEVKAIPGKYLVLNRAWSDGDSIALSLDMRTRVIHPTEGSTNENAIYHIALQRGPLTLVRDARLDDHELVEVVDVAETEGYVETIPSDTADFDTLVEVALPLRSGRQIHLIDYMSAGTTGELDSMLTVWMPTRDYWSRKYPSEPVRLRCISSSCWARLNADGLLQKDACSGDGYPEDKGFRFIPAAKMFYTMQVSDTDLFVTAREDGQMIVKPYDGSADQLWSLERVGIDTWHIVSRSGNLLSEAGEDPQRIHLFADCQSNAQCWLLEPVTADR